MTTIKLAQFRGRSSELVKTVFTPKSLDRKDTLVSGHWGADWYMLNAFCNAVATGTSTCIASVHDSLLSHLTVFAAEEARVSNKTVNIE
jgi:hypothetical protein